MKSQKLMREVEFNEEFEYKDLPDETTPDSSDNANIAIHNTWWLKQKLLSNNAGTHNSIFRGNDVTKYLDDGSLWDRISSGTFEDLFIGDYISKNDVTWRIAGFDYYLHKGNTEFTKHHAVIVPDDTLDTSSMYETNEISGGYKNSNIVINSLPKVLVSIEEIFGSEHVLEFKNLLTTSVDKTRYNRWGQNTGASSNADWASRKLDLLSEFQLTGSITWSSSGFDTGSTNIQLPLFKIAPEFICNRKIFWLKDVANATNFSVMNINGNVAYYPASNTLGIRPFFFIG